MVGTDGFEDKLNQILNDPDSMAKIMTLAQSLGGSSGEKHASTPSEPPRDPPPAPPDDAFVKGILRLMQQAQHTDKRQEALLCALKPYLLPERQAKIDEALKIAKLSQLASLAFQNYGGFPGKGGKHV